MTRFHFASSERRSPSTEGLSRRVQPRLKLLVLGISAALAQLTAVSSYADSGNGVDTSLGNALNPTGVSKLRDKDPDGLGQNEHSRSPTGFLNAEPFLLRDKSKTADGWLYSGDIEIGALALTGDKGNAKFREYKDLKSGLYLNNFSLQAEQAKGSYFVDLVGGGLGHDDQYLGFTAGSYNDWRVKAFYNETPHVFSSNYRNLWSGTGTSYLKLKTLTPGGTTSAAVTDTAIQNAALAEPYTELGLVRKKGGARLDVSITDQWKTFLSYTNEKRQGARPYGLVMGGGGGTGGVETPESIDYNSHDFLAGVQYNDARSSLNLQASASYFRNNIDTMTIESPLFLAAANGVAAFPKAVFDQYPNNDFFNVKGEYARAFPEAMKARLTAVASASSSRQDDKLIPSSPYAGVVINGVTGGAWDTTASLSKPSAGAKIDSKLFDLGLALEPATGLDVKGKLRYYETQNNTEYWACNPLTGQWGRVINDGSGSLIAGANTAGGNPAGTLVTAYDSKKCNLAAVQALNLVPTAGNASIRNVPYDLKQWNTGLSGDYRLAKSSVSASLERETIERAHRERKETWEDKFKLGYVNRSMDGGTMRLSYERTQRTGSTYVADPYHEFYSASLGPAPTATGTNVTSWIHINDLHRKFDLADRDQNIWNARLNYALAPALDGSVSMQFKDAKYPTSEFGRNGRQKQNSVNFDLNWQASNDLSVYGYVAMQESRMQQRGLQQNACVIGTTYYLMSDGSMQATATRTPAQIAAGVTVVGNSGAVTAANYAGLCGSAAPTSPLYPTSRAWDVQHADRNDVFGIGVKYDLGKVKLDVGYTYLDGRTSIGYSYNAAALGLATSGAPTAAQLTTLGLIGNGFSDLGFTQNTVDVSLSMRLSKAATMRVMYRWEKASIRDWHYDGVDSNPSPAANMQTYLDGGPKDYKTNTVGLFVKYDF